MGSNPGQTRINFEVGQTWINFEAGQTWMTQIKCDPDDLTRWSGLAQGSLSQ